MKLIHKIFVVCLLAIPLWGFAQTTVEGLVTESDSGFGIFDAVVTNETTGEEGYTDFDGSFSITANPGDVLVISMDGYEDYRVIYNGELTLNVAMNPSATLKLDEVVVIGYGTTTHKDATGSVVGIREKDFNEGLNTAPEQLLIGKVAGLQVTTGGGAPGTGSLIRIRGGSSLSAVNDPLFVVDGVPLDNGASIAGSANPLNFINPSDIESISVLKDASATAIYGARASNGIIIITTKKGKRSKKLGINFNNSVAVYDRIGQIDVLSADRFRDIITQNANPDVAALLGNANTNWQDEIFKTAWGFDSDLGINGMIGDYLPFRVSVGYTDQDGILKTSNFKRTTGAINLSPSFFDDHLKVDVNVRGSLEKNRFADEGAIGAAVRMDPTQPIYSDNDAFGGYWEWLRSDGTPNPNATRNPLALLMLKNNSSKVKRSLGNAKFDYKLHFFPDITATLNLGYDYSEGKGSVTVPEYARMNYNVDHPEEGGVFNNYKQIRRGSLMDFYLNYNKYVEPIKSRFDVTAGYSYQKFTLDDRSLEQNFIQTNTTLDRMSIYDRVLIGFFGRFDYSFDDKYLLTATIRRDGSSRFAKDSRWGWFPSVGLGWNIYNEGFLRDTDVSQLKLRLSWGITGQENLGGSAYPYLPIYDISGNDLAYYPIGEDFTPIIRPRIYDPKLKWEEQTTWNLGLDFGFFRNKLWGSIDIYKKTTEDMLQTVAAPLPNLNNLIVTNIGEMENKGVELTLGGDIIRKTNTNWSVSANATFNENKITKISGARENEFYYAGEGISGGVGNSVIVNMVGAPAFSYFVYEQVYDEFGNPIEGAYVDQNGDGIINHEDLRIFHSGRPKWTLGFSSNLTHYNWDFSFAMRANLGNYVYDNVASDIGTYASIRGTNGYLPNIQADALNSNFSNNQYFTDYYIRNASFLKMDYITLGYTFKEVFDHLNVRFFGTVQNVFTITKYKGLDPEVASGIDNNFYPRSRVYQFGVNVKF